MLPLTAAAALFCEAIVGARHDVESCVVVGAAGGRRLRQFEVGSTLLRGGGGIGKERDIKVSTINDGGGARRENEDTHTVE